jgi:hypothetical protein
VVVSDSLLVPLLFEQHFRFFLMGNVTTNNVVKQADILGWILHPILSILIDGISIG